VTAETLPIPHWPGRMVDLSGDERVWLVRTPCDVTENDLGGGEVLCVHGMSGAATNWTDFMGELAGDFGCSAVDLPGSGFSPPPRTAEYLRPRSSSLWGDAERVRVPVLAIYGSHDRLVNPRGAAHAARAFRGAPATRVMVLPRTAHVAQMEHPAEVAGLFREMVNRVQGMPHTPARLMQEM
jgi:pimeloyl-ACP methyl ester carboxylesterase